MSRPQQRPSLTSICRDALRQAYPAAEPANIRAAAELLSRRVDETLNVDVDLAMARSVGAEVSAIIRRPDGGTRVRETNEPNPLGPYGPYGTGQDLPYPRPEQGPPSLSF